MYKVILFNHGQTAANGKVLLDTSSGENPGLTQAVVETKLNEAGSFNYSIIPTHPLYGMTSPLKVYVSVEEDGTEIFYGRILSVQTNPLTKIKSVTCEGALAFLLDAELPKDSADRTSSASDYFKYCINTYNSEIKNDANRVLKIGTINAEGVSEQHTYNNGSFSQIQSVMKSQLLNAHDGFFRIRRHDSTGDHYIDWVKQVGASNPQQIAITHNVISQNNTESGEDIFSMMRPIGNDDITLGDGDDGLLTVSSSMRNDYGAIIRTVTFDAKDTSTLRSKATDYIEKIRNRLTITGDISFVDFHFLDGSSTKVHVGDVFTNIEGYEGTKLTAESVSRNLLDAGKDKLTIKSDKELMNSATASGANSSNTTGVKAGGKVSSGAAHMYKFYHETQTDASIAAKNLYLSAEEKIEIRAQGVETYADEIDEKLSDEIGKVKVNTDSLQTEWTTYKGTEIYKNKDHIDQVCGLYQVQEYTDPQTGETVKNLVVQEGSALYQTHNGVIMGVYDSYNLTGGMMVQKINDQTQTLIRGDRVIIEGNTTIQDAMTIENGNLWVKKAVSIGTNSQNLVTINDGKVNADTVQVNSGGSLILVGSASGERYAINVDGGSGSISIKNFIKSAEVSQDGKTLTLTPVYGDAINFRRATTLSGTWSGSLPAKTLTVKTDDPQGPTYLVEFEGEYSANRTNLEVGLNGSVSIETVMSSKMLSIPVKVSRLTGTSSAPDVVYQTSISAAYNALLTDLTGDNKIITNGTYRPGSDFIGYSAVEVKVPDKAVGTRFGAGNGNYWVEGFYSGVSGGPTISGSETGYKLELTGTKSSAVVQIKYPTTEGTKIPDTAELSVGSLYTQGLNDVTITKNAWNSGLIQFTKSAGTASTKTVQLSAGSASWTGAVAKVRIWDGTTADPQQGGLDTGYDVTVNAASKLTSKVGDNRITANGTYSPGSNYIGFSSVEVDVSGYDEGWAAAVAQVDLPNTDSNEVSFNVKVPTSTVDGGQTGDTYTIVEVSNNAVEVQNKAGKHIARLSHKQYTSGYNAAKGHITVSGGTVKITKSTASTASTFPILIQVKQTATYDSTTGMYTVKANYGSNTLATTMVEGRGTLDVVLPDSPADNKEQTDPEIDVQINSATEQIIGLSLVRTTFNSGKRCVNLKAGDTLIGRINTQNVYDAGYDSGYDSGYSAGAKSVTHSPSASITTKWTGSVGGRTSLGSETASSLARTYLLIDAKCGGKTAKYYLTLN